MISAVDDLQFALANENTPINLVGYDASNRAFIVINDKAFLIGNELNCDSIQNIFINYLLIQITELSSESIVQLSNTLKERITKIDPPKSMIRKNLNFIVTLLAEEEYRRAALSNLRDIEELTLLMQNSSTFDQQERIQNYNSLCDQIRLLPKNQVPPDIVSCMSEMVPSNKLHLLLWKQARDTLVIWQELQKITGKSHPTISWATGDEMIEQASIAFPTWMTHHQTTLATVKKLNLSSKKLTSLPDTLGNLSNLIDLDISFNAFTQLPTTIGKLTALKELDSSNNNLTSIPNEIGELGALTFIGLNNNHLDQLPLTIGNLTRLTHFHLFDNRLSQLPPTFGNLCALEYLDVSKNQLSCLPIEIDNLSNLKNLSIGNNQITHLHDTFGNFPKLLMLHMYKNQITSLPPAFGNLPELEYLDMNDNEIATLPPTFGNFPKLAYLSINRNQLAQLPSTMFSNMDALRKILLKNNNLTSLPLEIRTLPALENVELDGNPMVQKDNNPQKI